MFFFQFFGHHRNINESHLQYKKAIKHSVRFITEKKKRTKTRRNNRITYCEKY